VSDTELSDAGKARMAVQIEGLQLAVSSKSPPSDLWLVCVRLHIGFKWRRVGSVRKGEKGTS
jgi:hypothetical protein